MVIKSTINISLHSPVLTEVQRDKVKPEYPSSFPEVKRKKNKLKRIQNPIDFCSNDNN